MTYEDYLDAIRSEANALSRLARTAPLDTNVPSCPEWTIEELVAHTSRAHRWATGNLDRSPDEGPISARQPRPDDQPVADWFDEGADAFLERLRALDPSAPAWSFTDDHTAGFWARRQAQETAMHRWDGQNAARSAEPITPELAVDGIDEILALVPFFIRFKQSTEPWGDGETIHFHATDEPGEWLVRLTPDGIETTREHAKGDVAVRGPASDVLLVMMNRKDPSAVEVFGDAALLDRWRERAKF